MGMIESADEFRPLEEFKGYSISVDKTQRY